MSNQQLLLPFDPIPLQEQDLQARRLPAPTSIGCNLLKSGYCEKTPRWGALFSADHFDQRSQPLYTHPGGPGNESVGIFLDQAAFLSVTLANLRLPTCNT